MTKTDLLLRQASYKRKENNNKNLVLFNNSLFTLNTIQEIWLKSENVDFVTCIQQAPRHTHDWIVAKQLGRQARDWKEDDNRRVYWESQLYVPKDWKLWEDIVWAYHNNLTARHLDRHKTQELIT